MFFTSRREQRQPRVKLRKATPRVERLEDRLTPTAGTLDTTFGQSGIALTNFSGFSDDQVQAVAVQADGKIVAVGSTSGFSGPDFAVARYNPNGSLDASFGTGGKVSTDFAPGSESAQAVVIQSDGKILVAGYAYMGSATGTDYAIVRYKADGSLDTSFGVGGKVTTNFSGNFTDDAQAMVLQTDGRIIVAGHSYGGSATNDNFSMARYNADGSLDTTFGQGGLVTTNFGGASVDDAYAVALQSDGRIVLAGSSNRSGTYDFALARYNANGSLDATFGNGGTATLDFAGANDVARAVLIQSDGKIVAGGYATSGTLNFALARFNMNGSLDTSFGGTGEVMTDFKLGTDVIDGLALQSDGKILAAGYTYPHFSSTADTAIARYNSDGSLDTSFGSGGKTITDVSVGDDDLGEAIALQSDGKIVVGGYSVNSNGYDTFTVLRYTNDIAATPPTANAGGPYTVLEGGTVQLDGSHSSDPSQPANTLTYQWDLDGDGIFGQTGAAATRGDETGMTPTFSAVGLDGPGTYIVNLRVTDNAGLSSTATATITIVNVPPTVVIGGAPATSPEGTPINLTSTVTDPSPADVAAGFTLAWSVTKNGNLFASGSGASFSFTPDDDGTYVVSLSATDKDGGVGTANSTIVVTNVPPTPLIGGAPASSPEGTTLALTASATDPSPIDTAAGFTFAWAVTKNGNAFASGSGASFAFTPDDDGTYMVSLSATDEDGGVGTASSTIVVTNVPPTPLIGGAPASSPEGTTLALTASATDPSPIDTAAGFTFAWAVTKNGNAFASGSGASFSFAPDDDGTYVVSLSATDEDGGVGTASSTIVVTNVPPTPLIGGAPASSPEGTTLALTASATDPSPIDTAAGFTFAWAVTKNGNAFASGSGASFSFAPDDDGSYVVSLSATDEDGSVGTASSTIVVTNVPPTPLIGGAPASSPEGTTLALTASATDPSPIDTAAGFTFAWAVTKNGNAFASGSGAAFGFTLDDNGSYVVSLSATDEDGSTGWTSQTITVFNVPPTASLAGPIDGVRGQTRTFSLSATDPSPVDQAAGFTFTINWGDGTVQNVSGLSGTQVGHIFTASGSYTVQVTAADKDGGVSPVATLGVTIQAVELQGSTLVVGGTLGDDTILFVPHGQNGVRVILNGAPQGTYSSVTQIVAYGQAGNDFIAVLGNITIPAMLFGGDGNDVLMGGDGPSVLVGGAGNDILIAGRGRAILIGGAGSDVLIGGRGDDILIGGSTAWDANEAALASLMAEWNSTHDYSTRVANLSGTGTGTTFASRLNGNCFLKTSGLDATVFDDGARDYLVGGRGNNWFFAGATDWVWDPASDHCQHHHSV